MKRDDPQTGLHPVTIAVALGASAAVWVVIEWLKGAFWT